MKTKTSSHPARGFHAKIYKIWMMRHVDVPDKITRSLAKQWAANQSKQAAVDSKGNRTASVGKDKRPPRTKYLPVQATVNGQNARMTLLPAGGGRYRMQLNTALRKAARADAGDTVKIELRLDLKSRDLPVPTDLRAGLKENPEARNVFESLTPAHRRHIIQWFDSARRVETRIRRLGFTIDYLQKRRFRRQGSVRQKQEGGADHNSDQDNRGENALEC